jgi:hypothetical protein
LAEGNDAGDRDAHRRRERRLVLCAEELQVEHERLHLVQRVVDLSQDRVLIEARTAIVGR